MPDLAIENGVVKLSVALTNLPEIDAKFNSFIADLQKKCNLKLTIDSTALDASSAAIASKIAKVTTAATKATSKTSKDFDDRRLNSFFNAQQRMALRLRDMGRTTAEYDRFVQLLNDVKANGGKGFEKLASASIEAQHSVQALNKELKDTQAFERSRAQLASKLTDGWFASERARLDNSYASADPTLVKSAQAKLQEIKDLGDVSTMTRDQLDQLNAKIAEYNNIVSQIGKTNSATRSFEDQATALANLKAQYEDYMSKYGQNLQRNLPLLEKFRQFGTALSSGSLTSNAAAQQFAALREEAKKSGIEIETVRQRMTNLFGQHFNTALIMLAIRGLRMALRQLWQDIKEVNEALVQTQIVTGLSGAALEAYTDKAYAAAEKSRDKITNILSESTAYGRLGYDSELSVQLAQLTSMYSKLGDVDTSDATDAITALMKAFDLEDADEIELALDKMIYVGNNFPISAAGLGEGLNNAASALSSAGNSLEQTLALLMAANATVQNPSKSSTAMRTITARIRNTKAELDELGEELDEKYDTVAKYQKELLGLTGVDILDATGKNFRATYDILKDLAGVWSTLSSAQQAAVTTMLAGTRNQDIFASLMKNFPSAEDAMSGMGDAAGLMDEKFKAVEGSVSGAMSGLSNAWSKFSNTLLNSNDIVKFIGALTSLVNILERLTKATGGGAFITGTLALITFFRTFRQFGQIYPQMQATMSALQGVYAGTGNILNASQLQTVTQALSGFTNAQQRAIMTSAGFPTAAQAQVLSMQNMSTAGLTAGGAMSTLGASIDGLKAKMTAFVQSGSVWIIIIMLLAQVIMGIINMVNQNQQAAEQAAEEAKRKAKDAQQAQTDAIKSAKSSIDSLDSDTENYQNRLDALAEKFENAAIGTDEYVDAKLELKSVQKDIVEQFGAESGAIRGVTEDLRSYATRLDEVSKKQEYLNLMNGENASGTIAALRLFGYQPSGERINMSHRIMLDGVTLKSNDYKWTSYGNIGSTDGDDGIRWVTEGRQAARDDAVRQLFGRLIDSFETSVVSTQRRPSDIIPRQFSDVWSARIGEYIGEAVDHFISEEFIASDTFSLDSITVGNVDDFVKNARAQISIYSTIGNYDAANLLSQILGKVIEATGYTDALEIFNTWVEGQIRYGTASNDLLGPYTDLQNSITAYNKSISIGDQEGARKFLPTIYEYANAAESIAKDKGYDWALEYLSGITDALGDRELLLDLSIGTLMVDGTYEDIDDLFLDHTNAQQILRAGEFDSLEEAVDADPNLYRPYKIYERLKYAADYYEVSIEEIISALVLLHGLSNGVEDRVRTLYNSELGKPANYDNSYAFLGQNTATEATGRVGALDKQAEDYLRASSSFYDTVEPYIPDKDVSLIDPDAAKETIDLINDYFGTSFEDLSEENIEAIRGMLEAAGDDIYGAIEGNISDALNYVTQNADEYSIDMGKILDTESGTLNIDALVAALNSIPTSADQAGALASAALADKLRRVAGMRFGFVQKGETVTVTATDGYIGSSTTTKRGGGGGGHHSQISDDIDNVERLIKLFKELLNYYDEGSEQWIARQRQIIDKYKAGVEIAMAEYDRLIKKGLKQTDDDVKKIVDTILEYQGDIFEESKKLWEAVRQNQIDAIKHTKDQNDAAIELEKTHHDLLISIRNERRELEDELKAARDAYSEVMTPEELDALFSAEDFATLMDKLAGIEGDAMELYRDYREQIAAVSEDETYMIEHITDEFKRQYDLKMKEYEIAKAELGVARAQQELENVKNEQTVMMLIGGRWQWVADPEKVLEAEQKLADAEQELADAQDEYDFQSLIHTMEAQSSEYQRQIDALEALTFSMDELAEQIHLFSDSVYKELLSYLSQIAQNIFDKYDGDTAIPAFAEGGVIKRSGLATVHSGEPIFSTADAAKLWRFVHDLGDAPVNTNGVYSGITSKLISANPEVFGGASPVSIDNSINIPGGIHVHGEMAQQLITLLKEVVAPYNPNA